MIVLRTDLHFTSNIAGLVDVSKVKISSRYDANVEHKLSNKPQSLSKFDM